MRKIFLFSVFVLSVSCSSIRVFSDHDNTIDFSEYTTYAFFKPGIEEVEISDLDKRRILKAIESQMETKGLAISSTPDLLVNIAVKATDRVIVNNNLGWGGWGWDSRNFIFSAPALSYNNHNTSDFGGLVLSILVLRASPGHVVEASEAK